MAKRFRDFWKTVVSDDSEDTEYILNQYLRDMDKKIAYAKETVRKQNNFYDNFKKQREDAEKLALKREKQAGIALKAGEEELSQKALAESIHYKEKMNEYQSYIEETEDGIKVLREQLRTLELEHRNLLDKKNSLIARVTRAKALQGIQATLGSLKSEHFRGELRRVQEQITKLTPEKPASTEEELDEIDKKISQLKEEKVETIEEKPE